MNLEQKHAASPSESKRIMVVCWSAYYADLIGDRDNAAKIVMGLTKDDPTDKMVQGSDFHDFFEAETLESGRIPAIFEFDLPKRLKLQPELYGEVMLDDWLLFRYRIRLSG